MMVGFTAALMLGGLASVAWADGGHGIGKASHGHGYGLSRHGMAAHGSSAHRAAHWLLRHQQDLGLTEEQVARIKALSLDQDRASIRARADVKVAGRELQALVSDERTELAAIEAKVKERAILDANVDLIGIKAKRELAAVLSPEQREKQKAILEGMHRAHRERQMKAESQAEQAPETETGTVTNDAG